MSITRFTKICSSWSYATDNNTFWRDDHPWQKTRHDQKYYCKQADPFHVAHKDIWAKIGACTVTNKKITPTVPGSLIFFGRWFWFSPNIRCWRIIPAVADTVFPSRINGIIGTDQVRMSNLNKRCMNHTITYILFFLKRINPIPVLRHLCLFYFCTSSGNNSKEEYRRQLTWCQIQSSLILICHLYSFEYHQPA